MEETPEERLHFLEVKMSNLDKIFAKMEKEIMYIPYSTRERALAEAQLEVQRQYRGSLQAEYDQLVLLTKQQQTKE